MKSTFLCQIAISVVLRTFLPLNQWHSQDSAVERAQGVWGTEVPQRDPAAEPLVGGSGAKPPPGKLTAYYEYLAANLCTILCI